MVTLKGPAIYNSVTVASQQVTLVLGQRYVVTSSIACWIKLGSNPTAAAATVDNIYLAPDFPVVIQGVTGMLKLAVIRNAADGHMSLAEIH
jgi:hypothetical protein